MDDVDQSEMMDSAINELPVFDPYSAQGGPELFKEMQTTLKEFL